MKTLLTMTVITLLFAMTTNAGTEKVEKQKAKEVEDQSFFEKCCDFFTFGDDDETAEKPEASAKKTKPEVKKATPVRHVEKRAVKKSNPLVPKDTSSSAKKATTTSSVAKPKVSKEEISEIVETPIVSAEVEIPMTNAKSNKLSRTSKKDNKNKKENRNNRVRRRDIKKSQVSFFDPPGETGPVAKQKRDLERYDRAVKNGRPEHLKAMSNDRKIIQLAKGAKIKVLNMGMIYSEIRMLNSDRAMKTGWVHNTSLGVK